MSLVGLLLLGTLGSLVVAIALGTFIRAGSRESGARGSGPELQQTAPGELEPVAQDPLPRRTRVR
jgi:hypothetical protein